MRAKEHVLNLTVGVPVVAVQMMHFPPVRVLAVVVVRVVVLLGPLLLLRSRVPGGVSRRGRIVRGAICLCICAAGRGDVPFL